MPFDLNGNAVSSAVLRIERRGEWTARGTLTDSPALVAGARVTLRLGDLVLVGTLRPSGNFGGTSSWNVIGGAGRWDATVPAKSYGDPGGVLLSQVARDLVTDAGEVGAVLNVPDRSLGPTWTRPAMLARDALDALTGGVWYVAPDGVTHLGARPSTAANPSTLTISPYDAALRRGTARLADDALAQLLPGCVLTAKGLPGPLTIGSLVATVAPGSVEVEIYGERSPAEILQAAIDAQMARTRYHAPQPYTVSEVNAAGISVKPADARAQGFPGLPPLPQIPGIPGFSCVLVPGAGVLVAWPSGDPGSATIVGYAPGVLPDSVSLDATTAINLGGTVPVADSVLVQLELAKLRAAIVLLGGSPAASGGVGFTKLKGG